MRVLSDDEVRQYGRLRYALAWWTKACRRNAGWLFGMFDARRKQDVDDAFRNIMRLAPDVMALETDADIACRVGVPVEDAALFRMLAEHREILPDGT